MVQYRIPNLLSRLQPYIKPNNPNYDVLAVEHLAWIDASESSFMSDDVQKRVFKDMKIPLSACRIFPDSSLEPLRISTRYLMISGIIETLTDAPATIIEAQKWADIFKQAFKRTLGETEEPASIILRQLTDLVLDSIKDPYRPYVVESNIRLVEGMVAEAVSRENPDPDLTLETYTKARRDTIGIRPLFDIGRWIYEIDIPHGDLYSYKKEFLACGANHNCITIALRDPIANLSKNDRQDAIDYTYQKFCEVLADLEHQKKVLPSFGESEDVKVVKYIEVLMDVVVGTIYWSLECGRYGHFERAGTAEAPNWGDVIFDMHPL